MHHSLPRDTTSQVDRWQSAERIKSRQETDTIELIDDIRYYLDQRFRMRMDDLAAEGMYNEEETPAPPPKRGGANRGDVEHTGGTTGEPRTPEEGSKYPTHWQVWTEEEFQVDSMRAETLKFDELQGRIDQLLGE